MDDTTPAPESPEPVESVDSTGPIPSPQAVDRLAAAPFDPPVDESVVATPIAAAPLADSTTRARWGGRKIAAFAAAGALTLGAGFALGAAITGDGHGGRGDDQSIDRDGDGDGHMGRGDQMQPGHGMQGQGQGGPTPRTPADG